jgi:gamma-glutamyl-gamma-aminobutyrate hydrolase PuuD
MWDMSIKGLPVRVYNSDRSYTFRNIDDVDLPERALEIENMMRAVDTTKEYPVLLLEGGQDIHPVLYNEPVIDAYITPGSIARDRKEIFQYNLAKELNWAVFGICRGHQLLCALNGGTLYQDIYHVAPLHGGGKAMVHYDPLRAFRGDSFKINSYHHQAIKVVPSNAMLTLSAPDGIVEGVVYTDHKAISWQFHPEFMDDYELLQWSIEHMEYLDEQRSNNRRGVGATRDLVSPCLVGELNLANTIR